MCSSGILNWGIKSTIRFNTVTPEIVSYLQQKIRNNLQS